MSNKNIDSIDGWDKAITFAEAELRKNSQRRNQLRRSIRLLKKNKADGLKWPETAENSPESVVLHQVE